MKSMVSIACLAPGVGCGLGPIVAILHPAPQDRPMRIRPPFARRVPMSSINYQSGFGNEFATEALPGALPVGRNSPQRCAYGLYAEQLSGTAFTAPRSDNRRSWLYRIRPSAKQGAFAAFEGAPYWNEDFGHGPANPNRLRWNPLNLPDKIG